LICTKNLLTSSQEFILNLVISEDIYWPEYILYLACYFWCKYQASQQLENTLNEMSIALNIFIESSNIFENSSVDQELQATVEVDAVTLRTYMKHFLRHIRLLTIDAQKLEIILEKYCCFTPAEKNFLYSSCLGSKFAYLPKEFCSSRNSREHPVQAVHIFGLIVSENKNVFCGELYHHCLMVGKFYTDLDKNRYLVKVSVKFPTQIQPRDNESESYEEIITICLTNSDNKTYIHGPLTFSADYDSEESKHIYPPSNFKADNGVLVVTIIHHKSGYYPTDEPKIIVFSFSKGSLRTWESVGAL
jgi:hypothetical protein